MFIQLCFDVDRCLVGFGPIWFTFVWPHFQYCRSYVGPLRPDFGTIFPVWGPAGLLQWLPFRAMFSLMVHDFWQKAGKVWPRPFGLQDPASGRETNWGFTALSPKPKKKIRCHINLEHQKNKCLILEHTRPFWAHGPSNRSHGRPASSFLN